MWRKFWTVALAFVFIACLASVADAQRRPNSNRKVPGGGQQVGIPNTGNQGQNPGNGNQNDPPGDDDQNGDQTGGGTPDGETPADEDVCDGLQGATPGLYGLCIAFCEAHDCVPDFSSPFPYANCKKNDRKLLDKYRQKMKDGDPDMPCLPQEPANEPDSEPGDGDGGEEPQVECPCWGANELATFPGWEPWFTIEAFYDVNGDGSCWYEVNDVYDAVINGEDDWLEFYMSATRDDDCYDGITCSFWYQCVGPSCPEVDVNTLYTTISEEEFEACKAQIRTMEADYYN